MRTLCVCRHGVETAPGAQNCLTKGACGAHCIGMTLAEWMKLNGVCDAALALKTGGRVSRSQINRIRQNKSRPSVETAKAIAEVTGIDAGKLMLGA